MSCASCDQARRDGLRRCSVCGGLLVPPVEGALAPDPDSGEVVREIPGWRRQKREPSWKDEVRDRVRRRRRQRVKDGSLPLFPDPPEEQAASEPVSTHRGSGEPAGTGVGTLAPPALAGPEAAFDIPDEGAAYPESPPDECEPGTVDRATSETVGASYETADAFDADDRTQTSADDVVTLGEPVEHEARSLSELDARLTRGRRPSREPDDLDLVAPEPDEDEAETPQAQDAEDESAWNFSLPSASEAERPLERPAQALERIQAAILDLGLLVGGWLVVIYFAARVARVPIDALVSSWPYLAGFLTLLGLAYATYFTSATGQTLGKQLLGLRVLGPGSRPPTARRALGRALLGVIGGLAAGAGFVPLLFDPARRALHDRLAGTRVVRH